MDFLIPQEDASSVEINYPGASHFLGYSYIKNLCFSAAQMASLEEIIQAIMTLGETDFFHQRNAQRLKNIAAEYESVIGLLSFLSCQRTKTKLPTIFIEKLLFDEYPKHTLLEVLHLIRLKSLKLAVSIHLIEKLISKKNNLAQLLKIMRNIIMHMSPFLTQSHIELLIEYPFDYQNLLSFYNILFNPKWFDSYYPTLLEFCCTETFFIGLLDKKESLAAILTVITEYLKTQRRGAREQHISFLNKETLLTLINIKTDRDEWALACQVFSAKSKTPLNLQIIYKLAALSSSRLNHVVQASIFLSSRYGFQLNDDLQQLLVAQEGLVATLVTKIALHHDQSTNITVQPYLTELLFDILRYKPVSDLQSLCDILQKAFDKNLHITSSFFAELLGYRRLQLASYEEQIQHYQESFFPEFELYRRASKVSPPTALVTFIKTYRMHQLSEKVIAKIMSEEIAEVINKASCKKIINLCEKMAQQILPSVNSDVILRFLQFQAWLQLKSAKTEQAEKKGYEYWSLMKKIAERAALQPVYEAQLTQGQWIDMILSLVYQILRSYDSAYYFWPMLSERRLALVPRFASTESRLIAEQIAQDFHNRSSSLAEIELYNSPRFCLGVTTFFTEKELSDIRKDEYRPGKYVHFAKLSNSEKDDSLNNRDFYNRRALEEKAPEYSHEEHQILDEIFQKKPSF